MLKEVEPELSRALRDRMSQEKLKLMHNSLQMSSSHQYLQNAASAGTAGPTSVRLGEIEHLPQLSENLSSLWLNPEYSDVVLIVEGQRLYAHKVG